MGLLVAIVGYRTYPDGNVEQQVEDLRNASIALALSNELQNCFKDKRDHNDSNCWLGNFLMGHSSGAHIALLFLLSKLHGEMSPEKAKAVDQGLEFDSYIGLSGVYSIHHHFQYESWRGVEEISPMKPACDFTLDAFQRHSPIMYLFQSLYRWSDDEIPHLLATLPPILFVHGSDDSTVPFTSSADAAYMLRSIGIQTCTEYYIAGAEHQDTIMDLLFGGETRDVCLRFITSRAKDVPGLKDNYRFKSKL